MSFFSDSSDEDKVNELLNQAIDNSVLEQIANINCSSFDTDSVLPIPLETRFSRLKSFPVTNPKGDFNTQFEKKTKKKRSDENEQDLNENEFELDSGSSSDLFGEKTSKTVKKGEFCEKGKKLGSGSVSDLSKYRERVRNLGSSSDLFEPKRSKTMRKGEFSEKGKKLGSQPVSNSSKYRERGRNLGSSSDLLGEKTTKTVKKGKYSEKGKKLGSGSVSSPSNSSDSSDSSKYTERGRNLSSSSDLFGSKTSKTMKKTNSSEKGKILGSGYVSSPSKSSNSSDLSPIEGGFTEKKAVKKLKSCSDSSDFSPSPPKKRGWLWCLPKRDSEKKSKGQRGIRYDEDFLSGLSIKEQKLLKMASREEEKINREAEKIVKMVRQGSARMNKF